PEMEWELEDILIGSEAAFVGRALRDSGIREETGCTIIAIRPRSAGADPAPFLSNPFPEIILREGDTLIALGTHLPTRRARAPGRRAWLIRGWGFDRATRGYGNSEPG